MFRVGQSKVCKSVGWPSCALSSFSVIVFDSFSPKVILAMGGEIIIICIRIAFDVEHDCTITGRRDIFDHKVTLRVCPGCRWPSYVKWIEGIRQQLHHGGERLHWSGYRRHK